MSDTMEKKKSGGKGETLKGGLVDTSLLSSYFGEGSFTPDSLISWKWYYDIGRRNRK